MVPTLELGALLSQYYSHILTIVLTRIKTEFKKDNKINMNQSAFIDHFM